MALKDLTIDQNALQEELIESLVTSYIRYDINQKLVVFVPENIRNLTIPRKIVLYLLALRGWQYFDNSQDIPQDARPKDIAIAVMENGSTIRSYLQVLLKRGLIQNISGKYSIPPVSIGMIQNYLQNNER